MRRRPAAPYVARSCRRAGSAPLQNSASARSNASLRSTAPCASSSSRKRGSSPAANGYAFSSRRQNPWMVEIHAPSSSRARSWRPRFTSSARMRVRSSPAARRVYVMTRIESTSRPWSHTARAKRSTSTAVLPVPAPAETKTSPVASTAASCCSFTPSTSQNNGPVSDTEERCLTPSRPLHAAHGPQVAPRRALAAARVVLDVSGADASGEAPRRLLRARDRVPERVLVEVVGADVSRERLAVRLAQDPARAALAGERTVDAAERLDADEVAQHEHVQRDLEPQLLLDLHRRVRVLARLVVLHDSACAERIDVDAVDLPGERDPVAEAEAALQFRCRAFAAECDLEPPRHELSLAAGLLVHERLEVAPERLIELARLHLGHLHPHAAECLAEARAHQSHGVVLDTLVEFLDAELLREAREELEQRAVGDGAAQLRIDLGVDRLRIDEPVDEPCRRAVGEALELGDVERPARAELLEHERVHESRRPPVGADCSVELAIPAVRAGERRSLVAVARRQLGERAEALALRRRVLERPRERRERPPARPAANVVGLEECLHLLPERARLARSAVVGRRLAHEVQPLGRARARGIEEIAVAADRVGPLEPRTAFVERAPCVVVEERRGRAATRQAPLFEAEHEGDVELARACAHEVYDGDAARLVSAHRPQRLPVERSDEILARQRTGQALPAAELGEEPLHRLVRAQVEPRRLTHRRRLEAVRIAEHPGGQDFRRLDGVARPAEIVERGQRRATEALGLLDDPLGCLDRTAAQPALDEVDGVARH